MPEIKELVASALRKKELLLEELKKAMVGQVLVKLAKVAKVTTFLPRALTT